MSSQIIGHLASGDHEGAKLNVLVFVGMSILLGIVLPLAKYIGLLGEQLIYKSISTEYIRCLVSADLDYFNSNRSGYLTVAMRQYADSSTKIIRSVRDRYMGSLLRIILPLIVITYYDIWLGLIVLVLTIIQAGYMFWSSKRLDKYRMRSRELYRTTSGLISDVVSNIVTIKSTAQEKNYLGKLNKQLDLENESFFQRFSSQNKQFLGREIFTVIFIAILIFLTIDKQISGTLDIAGTVLIIGYLNTILVGISALADDFGEHDDFIDQILPGFDVIGRKNHITDPDNPKTIRQVRGDLEFKEVSFHYDDHNGKTEVLSDFSLAIPSGQKLGIVGLSGAGKSTLAKLILRFNEVTSGQISLDGIDIRSLRQTHLRQNIAYVPQEPLLFHDSIRHNLVLARVGISEKEMIEALKSAHAWEFVKELPDKLDSIVGERGIKLSGGQKQRIAIARAILQKSSIMLLDEATSALDSESEQIIKKSLSTILDNKTAVVIAHRLSTLSEMDRIIVLDKGHLVEDGTHDSLIRQQGIYARLWQYQQRLYDEHSPIEN